MDVRHAYDLWSSQYDTNRNRTRDLEATALRNMLSGVSSDHCLEIGCGTGKNTGWLLTISKQITAVDLSAEMLARAKDKINTDRVHFVEADISVEWNFTHETYDLVVFSLVLEHIFDLHHVFRELAGRLSAGATIYIGELHPFKQYSGIKAKFDTAAGELFPECFSHHISDFTSAAKAYGLTLTALDEFFDDENRSGIPRILTLVFRNQ